MRIGPDFGFYARRLVAESNPAVWESDFYSLAEINWRGVSFGYKVTDSGTPNPALSEDMQMFKRLGLSIREAFKNEK
jgi:hypothetical protein